MKEMRSAVERAPRVALAEAGVPPRYLSAKLDDFPEAIRPFPSEAGLYISGPSGTGKTHMATAVFRELLASAVCLARSDDMYGTVSAAWLSVPELLMELRGTFGDNAAKTEGQILAKYSRVRLLLLDDLGAEKASDWTGQSVYALLSKRLNYLQPTIVTSNLTLTELNETVPRLASRLGGMTYVALKGDDRRLAKTTE